jgi:hypothetical protein
MYTLRGKDKQTALSQVKLPFDIAHVCKNEYEIVRRQLTPIYSEKSRDYKAAVQAIPPRHDWRSCTYLHQAG